MGGKHLQEAVPDGAEAVRYQPYPEYKESDVEWLGNVPSYWEIKKVKHNSTVKARVGWQNLRSEEFIDRGPFCITGTDFIDGKINWQTAYHVSHERYLIDSNIQLKLGDLLITKDGSIGKLAIVDELPDYACLNAGVFVVRPKDGSYQTQFLYWVLSSNIFRFFIDLSSGGSTIIHLYQNVFEKFSFPLPPLSEQQTIAAFLDYKTAKIDALITKKKALLEKLAEKRTALISHAVTKGLDPKVPMRDSGIEWLGEIPAHWELVRIKHLTPVKRGASPRPIDDPKYFDDDGEFAWVRIADVSASRRYLESTTQRLSEIGDSLSVKRYPGDLFLSIAGTVGKPIITRIKCCIHDGFVYFPDFRQNNEFLYYIFACGQPYLGLGKLGTQLNLNTDTVGGIFIGVPSLEEQGAIVAFLDDKTAKLERHEQLILNVISRLQEYRSALITNAVTGMIDVRNFRLPEAEEFISHEQENKTARS